MGSIPDFEGIEAKMMFKVILIKLATKMVKNLLPLNTVSLSIPSITELKRAPEKKTHLEYRYPSISLSSFLF
jgi:hypothetical protein